MKIRHAAALALVGWYLMTPPVTDNNGHYMIAENAPLSDWKNIGGFDSADECTEYKFWLNSGLKKRYGEDFGTRLARLLRSKGTYEIASDAATLVAQCIASDDPRLKESSK